MSSHRDRLRRSHRVTFLGATWVASVRSLVILLLGLGGAVPMVVASTPQAATGTSLVLEGVTVVDVEHGKLLPGQRVVIAGGRIQAVGAVGAVTLPNGAQVVDAQDKYLMPGLWDLYVNVGREVDKAYPSFIANGVTGIRDMGHKMPIDSPLVWQREVRMGVRIGPRAILGALLTQMDGMRRGHTLINTPEEGRRAVDSVKAVGGDFLELYSLPPKIYFAVAAQARRVGLPVTGYLGDSVSVIEASDSGQRTIENFSDRPIGDGNPCLQSDSANEARCAAVLARLVRNGTWWSPMLSPRKFIPGNFEQAQPLLSKLHRLGMPILSASAVAGGGGTVHEELATLVEAGLTPLEALRAATLNPAKYLKATDSLGTVAPGKLADLVLLDDNPLADITNTTTIHAVVANGRYYDRAALDQLLADAQASLEEEP